MMYVLFAFEAIYFVLTVACPRQILWGPKIKGDKRHHEEILR